ncbi:hypothetical protein AVEN_100097-1, partial [Araneus ventricosus]
MSRPSIVKWCQQFEDGRGNLTDEESQGRPTTVSKDIRHGAAGGRYYSQLWQKQNVIVLRKDLKANGTPGFVVVRCSIRSRNPKGKSIPSLVMSTFN